MTVTVRCRCGHSFEQVEFAGRRRECPKCGADPQEPTRSLASVAKLPPSLDPVFQRSRYLLRQKHLAISEKYYVWDEEGRTLLFVERPAHVARRLLACLGAVVTVGICAFGMVALSTVVDKDALAWVLIPGMLVTLVATVAVIATLSPKRHVYFYRDDTAKERLLRVDQDQRFAPITASYTVRDATGQILATLRKNHLHGILRKRWHVLSPGGTILTVIREDSILRALLRRVLGPLFGLLRTNFIYFDGESEAVLGEFHRKLTLLDRYVLDLSHDVEGRLDPRIALAAGVMLDTGERR